MKNIFSLAFFLIFFQVSFSQSGLRISHSNFFDVRSSFDISASRKESGLDIVAEIEYSNVIYLKSGIEAFSVLEGGYRDVHAAIGMNLVSGTNEKNRFYAGIRSSIVFREGFSRWNPGIEGGIERDLSEHFAAGFRVTVDRRNDQQIFGWNVETKFSTFLTLAYKWKFRRGLR